MCGSVGVLVGFEATRFLSATGVLFTHQFPASSNRTVPQFSSAKNFKILNDRTVLHGVPFFLIFLIMVHAVENLHCSRDQTISSAAVISTLVCC